MLQYLVIVLDDASVAYCHADNPLKERNLMSLETLKKGILFGMKQNLMIQYVFPDYALPKEYSEVIESIDNVKIYPFGCKPVTGIEDGNDADVEVANEVPEKVEAKNLVLRLAFSEMLAKKDEITKLFASGTRINLCITDVEQFTDEQIDTYKQVLNEWNAVLLDLFARPLQARPIPAIQFTDGQDDAGKDAQLRGWREQHHFCPEREVLSLPRLLL